MRVHLWLALPLLGSASVLTGCERATAKEKPPALVRARAVESVVAGSEPVRYSGNIKPYTQVTLAFKVGGYIEEILRVRDADGRLRLVQAGDRVRRGAILARVRQTDYSTKVSQARSQLDASAAAVAQSGSRLAEAVASHEQARSGLAEAQAAKRAAESQRMEARASLGLAQSQLAEAQAGKGQARAALAEAQASLEQAALDFGRATKLLASESMTRPEYDAAKARHDAALAKVDQAREQIAILQAREDSARAQIQSVQAKIEGANAQVGVSEASLARTRGQIAASRAVVEAARAQVASGRASVSGARAQLAESGIALADAALKAAIDGVVMAREAEIGALASPGTVGFVLADTSRVKVVFGVPDRALPGLRLGQPVSFTTDAYPGVEFRGRITAISPTADAKSRVFDVEVTASNPRDRLKAGMIATLVLGGSGPARRVAVVPLSAIVRSPRDSAGYAVFVVEREAGREVAHARDVKLGAATGNMIAVSAGVKSGERVISTGATLVVDGDPVRIIP